METEDVGSVSILIRRLKSPADAAERDAATRALWHRYYLRLVSQARHRLGRNLRGRVSEEDVAAEAIEVLFRYAAQDRFPRLDDRDDLWRLLQTITACKSFNALRKVRREGKVHDEQWYDDVRPDAPGRALDRAADDGPGPEETVAFTDLVGRLMSCLGLEERRVAMLRLRNFGNKEIAAELGLGLRSVERKLQIVRNAWAPILAENGVFPASRRDGRPSYSRETVGASAASL